jgi:hypothetical protein
MLTAFVATCVVFTGLLVGAAFGWLAERLIHGRD